MKTIVLIRHAKSSWEHDVSDEKRPLSQRGFNDAKLLAKEFLKYNFNPEIIYSSPAKRAITTCHIFMDVLKQKSDLLKVTDELYDFGGNQVANFIKSLDDDLNDIMIFGHNHAFTAITNTFGDKFIDNVPTSGLVKINFDISSWKLLKKGHTELMIFPKHLK